MCEGTFLRKPGRSYLFAPADRLDRAEKALLSAADAVVVDLEDGVGLSDKAACREALTAWTASRPYLLRINAAGTDDHELDLVLLAGLSNVDGVVLPKSERADDVRRVADRLPAGARIYALVESAAGLLAAPEIARSGVERLMFGPLDYAADLSAAPTRELLAFAQSSLVVASAAARLAPPVDGPTVSLDDPEATRADAELARSLGFAGKLCIHPSQIEAVNSVFSPTAAEVEWARGVVDAARGGAVVAHEGTMIDAPVLRRAHRILGVA